jgi:hypothetical protein
MTLTSGRKQGDMPAIRVPTEPAVLGYAAGLIDAEGHIGIASGVAPRSVNRYYHVRVIISNTDQRMLDWLVANFGGWISAPHNRKDAKPAWKPLRQWGLQGANAATFIRAVQPYLVLKAEQAVIALTLRDLSPTSGRWKGRAVPPNISEQREALKQRIHELNRRGQVSGAI